jgi:hypothetical protein
MNAGLQVDEDNSGEIEFSEFCKVIIKHKAATAKNGDEGDTLDAFVALGGNPDKTGKISTDKLRATIKVRMCTVCMHVCILQVVADHDSRLRHLDGSSIILLPSSCLGAARHSAWQKLPDIVCLSNHSV